MVKILKKLNRCGGESAKTSVKINTSIQVLRYVCCCAWERSGARCRVGSCVVVAVDVGVKLKQVRV